MTDDELSHELTTVFAHRQCLQAQELRLVREADGRGLAKRLGATSTTAWLIDLLRVSGSEAHRMVSLARTLDSVAHATARALDNGVINVEQARIIAQALTGLRDIADPPTLAAAEQRLISDANMFEPRPLQRLATRVLALVAPQLAERQLSKQLRDAETRAYTSRFFTLRPDGAGGVRVAGRLSNDDAAIINAAIEPLCTPTRTKPTRLAPHTGPAGSLPDNDAGASPIADERTPGQRRADALVEVCALALHTGQLPDNGGDRAQVVLTMNFHDLRDETGAGQLDNGDLITAHTARCMSCDAGLLPAVLGTQGQILDLGRERRLFTGPIRRALMLRDRGCAFPGCDRPPTWTECHHPIHWANGGKTSLTNGVCVCRFHHRLLHHSDWTVHIAADGLPEFTPPKWIDPTQTPRRNQYHRRT